MLGVTRSLVWVGSGLRRRRCRRRLCLTIGIGGAGVGVGREGGLGLWMCRLVLFWVGCWWSFGLGLVGGGIVVGRCLVVGGWDLVLVVSRCSLGVLV